MPKTESTPVAWVTKDEVGYEFVLQVAFEDDKCPTREERKEFLGMVSTLFHGYFPANSGSRFIATVTRKVS
jgi:hypothetical protein